MDWRDELPSSVVFVDVETTGLTDHDRVVSLGAVWLSTGSVSAKALPAGFVHLIFNAVGLGVAYGFRTLAARRTPAAARPA